MDIGELLASVRQRVMGGPGGEMGEAGRIAMGDVRMIDSRRVLVYLLGTVSLVAPVFLILGWVLRGVWQGIAGW